MRIILFNADLISLDCPKFQSLSFLLPHPTVIHVPSSSSHGISRRLRRLIYICSCQLCFVSEKGLLRMQNFPFIFKILYPSFTSNLFSSCQVSVHPLAVRFGPSCFFILYVSTPVFCDIDYFLRGFLYRSSARLLIPATDFNN